MFQNNKYIDYYFEFLLHNIDYLNKLNDIMIKIEENENKNNICYCKSILTLNKIFLSNLSISITVLKNINNGNFQKGIII